MTRSKPPPCPRCASLRESMASWLADRLVRQHVAEVAQQRPASIHRIDWLALGHDGQVELLNLDTDR